MINIGMGVGKSWQEMVPDIHHEKGDANDIRDFIDFFGELCKICYIKIG